MWHTTDPEKSGTYLVTMECDIPRNEVGVEIADFFEENPIYYMYAGYSGAGWYEYDMDTCEFISYGKTGKGCVLAWTEMPEPYKEERA